MKLSNNLSTSSRLEETTDQTNTHSGVEPHICADMQAKYNLAPRQSAGNKMKVHKVKDYVTV